MGYNTETEGMIMGSAVVKAMPIHAYTFVSLWSFFQREAFLSSREKHSVALIKEKENTLSLYHFFADECEQDKPIPKELIDHKRKEGLYTALSGLQEVCVYPKYMSCLFFGKKTLALFVWKRQYGAKKMLYVLNDSSFMQALFKEFSLQKSFIYREENGIDVLWYFFKKVILAVALFAITWFSLLVFLASAGVFIET